MSRIAPSMCAVPRSQIPVVAHQDPLIGTANSPTSA